jgi:hypothetical protein
MTRRLRGGVVVAWQLGAARQTTQHSGMAVVLLCYGGVCGPLAIVAARRRWDRWGFGARSSGWTKCELGQRFLLGCHVKNNGFCNTLGLLGTSGILGCFPNFLKNNLGFGNWHVILHPNIWVSGNSGSGFGFYAHHDFPRSKYFLPYLHNPSDH